MSWSNPIVLHCDGDGIKCLVTVMVSADFGASPAAVDRARREAAGLGWSYVAVDRPALDLCPTCTQRYLERTGGVV